MSGLGVICSLFMLANLTLLIIETWIIETILLAFMIVLGIYSHPLSKAWWVRSVDMLMIAAEIVCAVYVVLNLERLIYTGQTFPTPLDLVIFSVGIIVLMELTRRAVGWVLPAVAVVCIVYAFFGQHIWGLWGHPGFSFSRITGHIYSENGIFTIPMRVVVRYIYLFLLLGAFLNVSGV